MPQLDISFYFSQITWLAISFFSFFCISKWLILPRLEKNLTNRASIITSNIEFANQTTATAKQIIQSCEQRISRESAEIEKQIAALVENCKKYNNDKLSLLKKELCEKENNSLLQINSKIAKAETQMHEKLAEIVCEILNKIYLINNVDKGQVDKIYKQLVISDK